MPKQKKNQERREKGSGSIVQRGGKYYARVRRNGKDEYSESFPSRALAEAARERMVNGVNPRFLPSFEDYYLRLLQNEFQDRYEPETLKLHETFYRTRVLGSPLGALRLDRIKKGDVQAFIDRLRPEYRRASLRRWVSCVHTVLEHATEEQELIMKNPAKSIRLPDREPRRKEALDAQGSHDLPLRLAKYPRLAAMVTVLLDTGVRPGELCALRWADLDEARRLIVVRHTMSRTRELKAPKDGEERPVHLTQDALEAILAQPRVSPFVFTTDEGDVVRPDWLAQQFRRHREKAGCPTLSLRGMRKTLASIGSQIDLKATQEILGHATPDMTLGVYAEARASDQAKAVKRIERAVKKRGLFADGVNAEGLPVGSSRRTTSEARRSKGA